MSVHFFCGGLARVTAASATYLLDLIRTSLAAQQPSGERVVIYGMLSMINGLICLAVCCIYGSFGIWPCNTWIWCNLLGKGRVYISFRALQLLLKGELTKLGRIRRIMLFLVIFL